MKSLLAPPTPCLVFSLAVRVGASGWLQFVETLLFPLGVMAIAGGEQQCEIEGWADEWRNGGAITKSLKLVFQRPLGNNNSGLATPLEKRIFREIRFGDYTSF